jgi:hypothetical protein
MMSFAAQGTVITAFAVQTFVFDGKVTETLFNGILLYCLAYVLGSIIVYRQLPDPHEAQQESSGSAGWRELLRHPDYRVILFASAAQFLIGIPLLAVYALTILDVPAAAVGAILIARAVASLACAPLGGWFIGRVGTSNGLRLFGIALFVQMLVWTVVPVIGASVWAIAGFAALVVALQVSKSTFALALATVEFEVVRPEHRVRTFTLVDVVSSTAMQVNLALGAALVAASASGVLVDLPLIRLDLVKIIPAVGAVVALYLMRQYRQMAARNSPPGQAQPVATGVGHA